MMIVICPQDSVGQNINDGCNEGNFGIDADLYANSNSFGVEATSTNNSDDWFFNPSISNGLGIGVIDVEETDSIQASLQAGNNLALILGMSRPFNTIHQGKRLLDAIYGRDFFGGSQSTDFTAFTQASKNGEDPAIWDTGPMNVTPKNDLIDCYAHLRRDGIHGSDDLWLYAGFSRIANSGDSYLDVEFYAEDMYYTPGVGFTSAGEEEGHTAWLFDSSGNVRRPGDIVISVNYSTTKAPEIDLRIWTSRSDFENIPPATFSYGADFDGSSVNSTYGYAVISPPPNGTYACGLGNDDLSFGPPWGTLSSNGNFSFTYEKYQFAEIGINLNAFGIDPSLIINSGNIPPCSVPFSSLLFKARASKSFTSQLKDFSGPYPFDVPTTVPSLIAGDTLNCIENIVFLGPNELIADAYYSWITPDGNIISGSDSSHILIDQPGSYTLYASSAPGCLVDSSTFFVPEYTSQPNALVEADVVYDCNSMAHLTANPPGMTYQWTGPYNFTEEGEEIWVDHEGLYIVEVTDPASLCSSLDSIYVPGGPCLPIDYDLLPSDSNQVIFLDTIPPLVNWPEDLTLSCLDNIYDFELTGEAVIVGDNCFSNAPAPFFLDLTAGGTCGGSLTYNRIWYVQDNCGNLLYHTQQIQLLDTIPPTFITPPNITIDCDSDLGDLTTTGDAIGEFDACDQNIGEATFTDNVVFSPYCNNNFTIVRLWSLVDACGNEFSDTQIISSGDYAAPVFDSPADITISCEDNPQDLTITGEVENASDDCSGGPLSIEYQDIVSASISCQLNSSIQRTWTVTDDCGNSASAVQIISIIDSLPPTFDAPADLTVSCEVELNDLGSLGQPTNINDNCQTSQLSPSYQDSILSTGPCPTTKIVSRTWRLADLCGNMMEAIQIIEFEDLSVPSFTVPPDVTIGCDEDPSDLFLVGDVYDEFDSCHSTSIEASYSDSVNGAVPCNGSSIITRTWSVIDGCGNAAIGVQSITMEDITPPTFLASLESPFVSCDSLVPIPVIGVDIIIEDACDTTLSISYSETQTDVTCPNVYILRRVWTAIDDCGNLDSLVQELTIEDSSDPVILVFPPDVTITCDSLIPPNGAEVSDNCSSNIDVQTSDLVQPGTCDFAYKIIRTWSWVDDCGNTNSTSQEITVIDETYPIFAAPADTVLDCSANLADLDQTGNVVNEQDNCDSGSLDISYRDSLIAGFPCGGSQRVLRIWSVADTCGNESSQIQIIDLIDILGPEFTPPPDVTLDCSTDAVNTNVTGQVTVITDDCDFSPMYTEYQDSIISSGICLENYTIIRTWTLTDDCGNHSSADQTITIVDSGNPSFTPPADITVSCSENIDDLTFTGDVTDEGDGCQDIMGDATYQDSIVSVDPCGTNREILRTWELTDNCGNTFTANQSITIIDTIAPDILYPADITLDCEEDLNDLAIAGNITHLVDPCGSDSITISYQDNLIGGGSCQGNQIFERTWEVSDLCGNQSLGHQIITLQDVSGPSFDEPVDITLDCNMDYEDLNIAGQPNNVQDNCSSLLSLVTYQDSIITLGHCGSTFTVIRSWTATDDCGNETVQVQTIEVVDTLGPIFFAPPDLTISCDENLDDPALTGTVDSSLILSECSMNDLIIWYSDSLVVSSECPADREIFRTWMVRDDCGNESSLVQTIFMVDSIPPQIDYPVDITIDCSLDPEDLIVTGDPIILGDDCSPIEAEPSYSDSIVVGTDCDALETIFRTWLIVDECGNQSSGLQVITIQDLLPPVFFSPADTVLQCYQDPLDLTITGIASGPSDHCDSNLGVPVYQDSLVVSDSCSFNQAIYRTWSLSDNCGNLGEYLQIIYLVDSIGPSFQVPVDVTLSCEQDPNELNLVGAPINEESNCLSLSGQATFEDSLVVSDFCLGSIIYRTWTLSDDCGKDSSQVQVITVLENDGPELVSIPGDLTISCMSPIPIAEPIYLDGCSGPVSIIEQLDTLYSGCLNGFSVRRTWIATDSCSLRDTVEQIITVENCPQNIVLIVPASLETCPGQDLELYVNPNVDSTSLVYQWQFFDQGQGTWINIPGATGLTWLITNIQESDTGQYRCLAAGEIIDLDDVDCRVESQESTVGLTAPPPNTIITEIICPKDSVLLNGQVYSQEGSFWDTLSNMAGCDSILQIEISFLPNPQSTDTIYICQGDSAFISGDWYSEDVTLTDTIINPGGCDSLHITSLVVSTVTFSEREVQMCSGESILLGGMWQTEAGEYLDTIPGTTGCDTIMTTTLILVDYISISLEENLCEGDTIWMNGIGITNSTTLIDTIVNLTGCDTIRTIQINQLPHSFSQQNFEICEGDSLYLAGNWQTASAIYYDTLINHWGCDSMITLDLSVLSNIEIQQEINLCEGEEIIIDGITIGQPGNYTENYISSNGCDSLIHFTVNVNPNSDSLIYRNICQGEELIFNGSSYTSTGTYSAVFQNQYGCDSLVTLDLEIQEMIEVDMEYFLCPGDSISVDGSYYHSAEDFEIMDVAVQGGCDSLTKVRIQVRPIFQDTLNYEICEGDSIEILGSFYSEAMSIMEENQTQDGCDSTILYFLQVVPQTDLVVDDAFICQGDSVELFAEGAELVNWSPADGLSCIDCPNPMASPDQTTTYTVSAGSCLGTTSEMQVTVHVDLAPEITVDAEASLVPGDSLWLTYTVSDSSAQITWEGPNGQILCQDSCQNPLMVNPTLESIYTVRAMSAEGCVAEDQILVRMKTECDDAEFFFPNFITPNNDGKNDEFVVQYEAVKKVSLLRIFNRWGELVFETKDIDNEHWDGTFRSKPVNAGVFVFYLDGFCLNNLPFIEKGNITVIR
ncbi:MAG: gliding motility-associated C-terminal domain-containing protein [Saprospiraceae bacterium]|nr:gliding motility-associated C-terminal domain-containing protein [Saprospiraceae bacterium]